MQTIKISIEQSANGYDFTTGFKSIATIRKENNGTFRATFQIYATANNLRTLPDAMAFIGDAISNHFDRFGLDVEFTNA